MLTKKIIISNVFLFLCFFTVDCLAEGIDKKKKKEDHDKSIIEGEHHENHFEVELSYNNGNHFEFTSSVYFAHLTKFQGTVEFTGHHFAGCFVREIPLGHSKFGTFVGVGSTFGFEKEGEEHGTTTTSAPHAPDVADHDSVHRDWTGSVIFQSGLAYSVDKHWSTGFTLSPGFNVETHQPNFGMTLDLVFGF
ncbi:hypothetical protein [Flammeovirga agarivorans]|uniref:Outer membrane protein beta-barrel domain-containing protein n=1 Tax=Flammeovirga agarivorans TaxID=2726742 RepID=A0A7X8SHB2_9BACT|nr:hypothetical protein [Flammeovirga agarivorans]NLR90216.1 hypothetical protein [Flammeovirga agarivorans]